MKMRQRLITLTMMLMLLGAIIVPDVVYAFSKKQDAKDACFHDTFWPTYQSCIGSSDYCMEQAWKAWEGCMILKGYPDPYGE